MTKEELQAKIKECETRKREYKRMVQNLDLMRLALIRSYTTEVFNIKEYKRQLKEQKNV